MSLRSIGTRASAVVWWCLACGPSGGPGGSGDGSSTSSGPGSTGEAATGSAPTSSTGSTGAIGSTGAAGSTSTDATSTGAGSTEAGFIVALDGGCIGVPDCDVWIQDCCGGRKCVPTSFDGDPGFDGIKCVPPARDPVPLGGACQVLGDPYSGVDDCEFGAICWGVDPDTLTGTCVAQCKGSPDAPDCSFVPGTTCLIAYDGVLALCLPICDPLLQDCAPGAVCIASPDQPSVSVCMPDVSGDAGQAFDPCLALNSCDPGLTCVDPDLAAECDPGVDGCCTPYCDPDVPVCPGAGQQCLPLVDGLGLCGLP